MPDDLQLPPDPFEGGPMPGKDAALGEIRLIISGQHGPILDMPLMAATARAEAFAGVLFTFEYHRPCPHDEDAPCTCSPAPLLAALRLDVIPEHRPAERPPAPAPRWDRTEDVDRLLHGARVELDDAPAEPARSGYCNDERCGTNGLHPEHS